MQQALAEQLHRKPPYSADCIASFYPVQADRYTAFLVLYPVGVVSEMVLLYRGVPYVRERDLYSIHMPNKWNFAWDYALFIEVGLLSH